MIDLINFIQYNQDLNDIQAVLAVAIDFEKAFNRQNHNLLIELLSEMGVPGWLLQVVVGFLENREIEVFFKGEKSSRNKLPGGGAQGTILGLFLFLILINAAGIKEKITNTGEIITQPMKFKKPMKQIHLKYIDSDSNITRPVSYHNRTENTSYQRKISQCSHT